MNRPWKVMAEVADAVSGWQDFETRLFEILEADDPGGTWISSSMDDVDAIEILGISWEVIKDIFEAELVEEIRNHTSGNGK